jgi:hypothetical protein
MRTFIAAGLMLCCLSVLVAADAPVLRGRVVDPSGLPLPGATVTVSPPAGTPTVVVTDGNGEYVTPTLEPGRYDIEVSLPAFTSAVRRGVDLASGPVTLDLQLDLAMVRQDVSVTAASPVDVLGSTQPNAPVSVTREVMDIAMLPNSQFDDVLPLMPNVVRGPDGLIAVAGARATSGGLSVNGFDMSDPILGGSGVMLPLESVETMHVYAGGAPAEFGHATGGVTSVQTRSGGDRFHMSLDSFFPRLQYTEGGVGGVAFWDPNLGMGGPLGSRARYQQAVSYRYDRNSFTTLAGSDLSVFNALLSWTQLDVTVSDSQRLRVFLSADPRSTDRANITAFTPAASAPRVQQGGWSTGVSDAITGSHVLIDLHASVLHARAIVTPYGSDTYVLSHELATGSYFDRQDRRASRVEAGARLMWSPTPAQTITVGGTASQSGLDQSIDSAGLLMLRSDGSVARAIRFQPVGAAHASATAVGLFAQDRWSALPWLTLDAGVRYDETTSAGDPPLSPRVGWTIGRGDRATISGSVGLLSDAVPLSAQTFGGLPTREMAIVDPAASAATRVSVPNGVDPWLHVPEAVRWDLEMTRRLGAWTARLRYDERRGRHELVVEPFAGISSAGDSESQPSVLTSQGASQSRSVEVTAGFRTVKQDEWYVSYVRAAAHGSANSLDATEGLMRAPFIQPNLSGPLPIDVPHRLLAWGVFHLPSHFTVAPFLDARSGFPYTAIDDGWVMVGTPGMYRLPWTATLDLSVTRVTRLPRHVPEARVGLKLYNIVSVNTERDVQRDIERPDFGTRYDPVPRDFSLVFEFLWGRHTM